VDLSHNTYLTGQTISTDFPTTTGAYDTSYNGDIDVFFLKLNLTDYPVPLMQPVYRFIILILMFFVLITVLNKSIKV